MKAGDLIKQLAVKTGTDLTSIEEVITQLGAIDIEDAIAEKMTSNLITSTEAKNNPDIKGHFYSQFADGFDKQLDDNFKKLGLTDEVIAELKAAEPKSSKRTSLYADKVAEIQKDLVKANGKGNDEKAKQLEGELKDAKEALRLSIEQSTSLVNKHYEKEIDWNIGSKLSGHKLKEAIPAEFRTSIALETFKEYLKAKDAKVVLENGKMKLKRASDPTLDVTDFDFDTALSKSLADKNLLDTAVPPPNPKTVEVVAGRKVNNVALDNITKAREMMQEQL